jgi:hypothetical protein
LKIGIHSGLIDPKHYDKMGNAIWLFEWLVMRQTGRHGLVLGGMPLTYETISERMGGGSFNPRKVRLWLDRLRAEGYVIVTYLNYMMLRIQIVNQKKWTDEQHKIPFEPLTKNCQPYRQKSVNGATGKCQPKQIPRLRERESEPQHPSLVAFSQDQRSETSIDHDLKNATSALAWDRFFLSYPKGRIGETLFVVKQRFFAVHADDAIEEVMAGLERWKTSHQWRDERFIPYALNFLSNRKWRETPPQERNDHGKRSETRQQQDERTERNLRAAGLVH